MKVGEICNPDVLTMSATEPLAHCAREMMSRNVGSAVIVDNVGGFFRPVGIVTDRDVLRGQFDRCADLFCLSTGDVMSGDLLVLKDDTDVADAIESMSRRAVRRAPVVSAGGVLVGIVTFDDLLPVVAAQISAVAGLISGQIEQRERQRARW
jgi:CBS domain-containing protein